MDEKRAMSGILELWSEPWHALQRTLAQRLGLDETPMYSPARPAPTARVGTAACGTWIARARDLVAAARSPAPT